MMFAEVYYEHGLWDLAFWDDFLWGLVLLSCVLFVVLVGPALLGWVNRRREGAAPDGAPPADSLAAADRPTAPAPADSGPAVRRGGLASLRRGPNRDDRKQLRRDGEPTPVLLMVEGGADEPIACSVADRSRGGLGIRVDRAIGAGTVIRVRPADAPEDVAWVRLEVRHCARRGRGWHLGCRFTEQLPWSVVLLFG